MRVAGELASDYGLVTAVAARRLDGSEGIEVKIDDFLERVCSCTVTETIGQGIAPGGTLGLQYEQLGDGIVPAPRPTAAIC